MPHTNSWDEAKPAGSDQASSLDDQIRQFKLDLRERMALDHIWNSSLDHDGKHKKLTFRPDNDTSLISVESANSLTGAGAANMVDLAQTWNTTGVPTAVKVNVTNTASGTGAKLLDLQVGGTSKFSVGVDGTTNGELKGYSETVVAHGNVGATETIDCSAGAIHTMTFDANCTFTFSNPRTGLQSLTLLIANDGTVRTPTWPASVVWANGAAPTFTGTLNKVDIVSFVTVNGGTTWYGFVPGTNF